LLGVFVTALVVGGDGSGNGRERKTFGGRIRISGGVGQLTCGCSVVQADKAAVDSASSIGLDGYINWDLLQNGVAPFADDLNAIDVLGHDLDGGFSLACLSLGSSQALLGSGTVTASLHMPGAGNPAQT
jgi:hypothetical protein